MIATYLVLKIALQAVLDECNRAAAAAEASGAASDLKERIARLEIEFSGGDIDVEEYERRASEIIGDLQRLTGGGVGAGGQLEL